MPRSGSDNSDDNVRRNPRRARKPTQFKDEDEDPPPAVARRTSKRIASSASEASKNYDDDDDDDLFAESDEEDERPSRKRKTRKQPAASRRSARSTKYSSSMNEDDEPSSSRAGGRRGSATSKRTKGAKRKSRDDNESDFEGGSDEDDEEEEEMYEYEGRGGGGGGDGDDDDDPLKIQRIVASRSETLSKWKTICKGMDTKEVNSGSIWHQEDEENANMEAYQERYLVKWRDMSFLHCSWEKLSDLEELIEGSKTNLRNFFRKSFGGYLYTPEERCDGDYFDPAFTQIDRILEVAPPEGKKKYPFISTPEQEDQADAVKDFDICLQASSDDFETGLGRSFLVKWCNSPYTDATWECERDLVLHEIEYKAPLKSYLKRMAKPAKAETVRRLRQGDKELRRLYTVFGDKAATDETKVNAYKLDLQNEVYKNGGKLRDYQAEGVAWMIANYCNKRSSILADEMGLGKTLQTAAVINIMLNKLSLNGPVLIVAPLSTLTHWLREFEAWTDLNAIVYHGSAENRKQIRHMEFAYDVNRPPESARVAFNSTYLKKCAKGGSKADSPWMVQVVITTPEIMVSDDCMELAAVTWETLVVDEAHRLKNHQSKLTATLKDERFTFRHKILLTGTPIQNQVSEFWTLLNFIDPAGFRSLDDFVAKYGDMKSKERVDELHDEIRPYILRRLKEDVEKSVPPKEETLIEVEMTVEQTKYYIALYQKNLAFLHKGKSKDVPKLNNLAMQLRKCCNHLFLINGAEQEMRKKALEAGKMLDEGDFLASCSGKLGLLDKLLPRLREGGHRVLIFSQFKIMLDILEDYFRARKFKFERIDGSITGTKRQMAIDRFQQKKEDVPEGKEEPFIMMLTTRAGGVGITLTAADTCVIFDSDWNPQNDLQAQARCHRIGQEKKVQIYRLITSKSYEKQMFHMSSLKMGLDAAVLKGFEGGESSLSKKEIESLLKHGAYDVLNEEKAGTAEAESNKFHQMGIDEILAKRTTKVTHENTGSKSSAAGGTFSKATFKVNKSPEKTDYVDTDDPNFWTKMLGELDEEEDPRVLEGKRSRKSVSYAEGGNAKDEDDALYSGESDSDSDGKPSGKVRQERAKWGGDAAKRHWQRDDAEEVFKSIATFGYGDQCNPKLVQSRMDLKREYAEDEIKRMRWSLVLLALVEGAEEGARKVARSAKKAEDRKREMAQPGGGVLAKKVPTDTSDVQADPTVTERLFREEWDRHSDWLAPLLSDARGFAEASKPRDQLLINDVLYPSKDQTGTAQSSNMAASFADIWKSLKNRGWKAEMLTTGDNAGKTRYAYLGKQFLTPEAVLEAASVSHPELAQTCSDILIRQAAAQSQKLDAQAKEKETFLAALSLDAMTAAKLRSFLEQYAPLQLLQDRLRATRFRTKRLPSICAYTARAMALVAHATTSGVVGDDNRAMLNRLAKSLKAGSRSWLPHTLWTAKHDAVLIHAIAKHGWIEQPSSRHAIASDASITWGRPFDLESDNDEDTMDIDEAKSQASPEVAPPVPEDKDELRATADRAAKFVNENSDLLAELSGFGRSQVELAYGLRRASSVAATANAGEQSTFAVSGLDSTAFVVDAKALELPWSHRAASTHTEAVELPDGKDLLKRATTILTSRKVGSNPSGPDNQVKTSHGFVCLDQGVRCNILLAEMLRGLLRAPVSVSKPKLLIVGAAAQQEACERLEHVNLQLAKQSRTESAEDLSKLSAELTQIVTQIQLLNQSMRAGVKQYRNVLRVMLGEQPFQMRNSDAMFPERRKAQALYATSSSPKTSGERAMEAATRRLYSRTTLENNQIAAGNLNQALDLTQIECIILAVACSRGLPIWTGEWSLTLSTVDDGKDAQDELTWSSFGRLVALAAREESRAETERFDKLGSQGSDIAPDQLEPDQVAGNAKRLVAIKKTAANHAKEYASEPETLARKTILMLAKLLKFMGPHSMIPKSENVLGFKVLQWFDQQVTAWARCLEICDEQDRPHCLTAVDFVNDCQEQRCFIDVAAVLDKRGSRGLISQMALMSRNRSLIQEFATEEDLLLRMGKAHTRIVSSGETWEGAPTGWGQNTLQYDLLLLKRLASSGLDGVLSDVVKEGKPTSGEQRGADINISGLSKAAIQFRANQLVRELSALVGIDESTYQRLEDERKARKAEASQKPTPGAPAGGATMELDSADDSVEILEDAKPAAKPSGRAIDRDDNSDSEIEILPNPPPPKRKEAGTNDAESPEKKMKAA